MEKETINEIKEYFEDYLNGYSEKTIADYLGWFNRFPHTQFINEKDQDKAQEIINAFINRKDNSNKRGFLMSYLKCFGLFKTYDLPEKKRITKKKQIKDALTIEEIEILRKAMYKSGHERGLAFSIIYECGLRRNELKSIRWRSLMNLKDWMNSEKEYVIIKVTGKGKKERYVRLSSETLIKHLLYLKEKHALTEKQMQNIIDNARNINRRIIKFGEDWFYKHFTKTSKKVLGRNVNPHLLRHTRATHLLDIKVEAKDIQNYLGHSNLATTEIYLHRGKRKSLDNINKKIKKYM